MNVENHLAAVDPELLPGLEAMPPIHLNAEALAAYRQGAQDLAAEAAAAVDFEERLIPGPPGAPPVRILIHAAVNQRRPAPAILFIHGGGYVLGRPEFSARRIAEWAARLHCTVIAVGYRLAPEARYPAAVEDCHAALCWLHANAAALGIDAKRIAIAGESAGGGIAASLALHARDRAEAPVAFQLLIYPMIDDRTGSSGEHSPHVGRHVWTPESNRYGWASLLGFEPGSDATPEYAAPARARRLEGLPPTFVGTAALDLFVEENIEYARRLLVAGVPTELYVAPGAYHGFESLVADAAVSRRFTDLCIAALARAFALPAAAPWRALRDVGAAP